MKKIASALFAMGMLGTTVSAQVKESLEIGPGDLVHVQVYENPDMDEHVRVADSGEIPLLLAGHVKVAGETPAQAAESIADTLIRAHILLHPQVLVIVEEYATEKVSVMGEVRNPGNYAIHTPRSILDVLTLAGGLTELADRRVLVKRHAGSEKVQYFISNTPETAVDTAVTVNPGDTIVVPKASLAFALGDLARPGGYTMTDEHAELTVLELVARAGGTTHTAVPSHAILIRRSKAGRETLSLALDKMQKGQLADLKLQPDDIIYVPFSYMKNLVVSGSGIIAATASAAVYHF